MCNTLTIHQQIMQDAKDFAKKYAPQGAAELLAWKETSVLPEGVVRDLATFIRPVCHDSALSVSEDLFVKAILETFVEQSAAKK